MSTFTAEDLQKALEAAAEFGQENPDAPVYLGEYHWDEEFYPVSLRKVGPDGYAHVEFEELEGGEGEGDDCFMVISTGTGTNKRFFKKTGTYASYDGFHWEYGSDLYEVEQQEVKVMSWVAKK